MNKPINTHVDIGLIFVGISPSRGNYGGPGVHPCLSPERGAPTGRLFPLRKGMCHRHV